MRTTTIIRMVVIVSSKKYIGEHSSSCIWVRNNHITSLGIYLVLPADLACRDCRCATSFDRRLPSSRLVRRPIGYSKRCGSDARLFSPLSVDQAAAGCSRPAARGRALTAFDVFYSEFTARSTPSRPPSATPSGTELGRRRPATYQIRAT